MSALFAFVLVVVLQLTTAAMTGNRHWSNDELDAIIGKLKESEANADKSVRAENPCNSGPCKHGGTCTQTGTSSDYTCSCPPTFTGSNCQGGESSEEREGKDGAAKTSCQLEVEAIEEPAPPGLYVPQCDESGNYRPMQVHGSTGYRWCVDQNGNEIPGTQRPPYQQDPVCTDSSQPISTPPPIQETVHCQVDVQSYGNTQVGNTDCTCNFDQTAYVSLNGNTVFRRQCCDAGSRARGVNIIVIDPVSCTVTSIANFDTWSSSDNADSLANTLNSYASGTVVVGVTADSPTASYPNTISPALDALASYGVHVSEVGWRGNFAFVAQKGFSSKTAMAMSPSNSVWTSGVHVLLEGTSGSDMTIQDLSEDSSQPQSTPPPIQETACPVGFVANAASGSCYLLEFDNVMWYEAGLRCASHGGHLVFIDNAQEQAFIQRLVAPYSETRWWIGGGRVGSQWMNVAHQEDGETVDNPMTYTNWAPAEPNNQNQNEACAELMNMEWWNGRWNDDYCGDAKSNIFICEIDP